MLNTESYYKILLKMSQVFVLIVDVKRISLLIIRLIRYFKYDTRDLL